MLPVGIIRNLWLAVIGWLSGSSIRCSQELSGLASQIEATLVHSAARGINGLGPTCHRAGGRDSEETAGTLHFTILRHQINALLESTQSVAKQFRWPEQPDETPRTGRQAAVMREHRVLAANYSAADSHRHASIIRCCP
jgi:hypothetical protein